MTTRPRVLWLSAELAAARPTGRHLYSTGLANALAATGCDVEVVGLQDPDQDPADGPPSGPARVRPVGGRLRGGWRSILSTLPNLAYASSGDAMRAAIADALGHQRDVVVIDHLQMAWVVPMLARTPAVVVFVTHNHERSVRSAVARSKGRSPRGVILRFDAWKAARAEAHCVARADVVTSITDSDRRRFEADAPGKQHVLLEPGYRDGGALPAAELTTARRVGIIGSFDWHVKAENLRQFVAAADHLFCERGVSLVVAGSVPDVVVHELGPLRATRFVGWVPSAAEFVRSCRIGVVAEPLGGGFKLKSLDYVMNHVPLALVDGAVEGLPLGPDQVIAAPSHAALARAIVDAIDDDARLARMADEAFTACRDAFSWRDRGERLRQAIDAAIARRSGPGAHLQADPAERRQGADRWPT